MANTIITLKSSGVTGNVPNILFPGELAINYADGKLYYGDSNNSSILFDAITEPAGLDGEVQFNDSGNFGSSSGFTFNSLTESLTVTRLNVDVDSVVDGNVTANSVIVNNFIQFSDGSTQNSSAIFSSGYANSAFIVANSAYDHANTKVSKSGDVMTGDYDISGNLKSTYIEVEKELFAGIASSQATLLPNIIAQFTSNSETYTQVNQQNINPNGSADFVVTADVGTDTDFYIDLGINNSQFNDPENTVYKPLDGYLITKGSQIGQEGGNLVIGTITTSYDTQVIFVVGGANTENIVAVADKNGFYVNGIFTSATTNTIATYANTAFDTANDAIQVASTSGSYANSAYEQANTANINAATADQKAVSAGDYANSSYGQANTATTNAATADQKAVSAGDFANSAYIHANSAYDFANSVAAISSSTLAFDQANLATQYAQSAGDYANSAFQTANLVFDAANTKVNKSGDTMSGQLTITFDGAPFIVSNTTLVSNLNSNFLNSLDSSSFANSTFANIISQSSITTGVYANSAYDQANTATTNAATSDQKAVSAGSYANSAYEQANTANTNAATADQKAVSAGSYANSAYDQANTATTNAATADQKAVSAGSYANSAYEQANTATISASTADLKAVIAGAYANSAYNQANTATTNAATADQKAVSAGSYANSAYDQANTATTNASTADQKAVIAGDYANSAFIVANTSNTNAVSAGSYANSAYNQANTATTNAATADQKAVSAGVYANSAYNQANTATQYSQSAGSFANSAYEQANTATTNSATADQKAVSAGSYANSAYNQANTATTDAATADQKAVSAGSYANSSYEQANTATTNSITTGLYANSAYNQANTATTNAATANSYATGAFTKANTAHLHANSAYNQANTATTNAATADQKAVSAGSYANSAYVQANTATTNAATADQKAVSAGSYANSAYALANTKYSSSGGTIDGNVLITGNLSVTGNVTTYSSQDLIINDPIILLANNNTSNLIDIGWTGHYQDNGNTKHLGVISHAATKTFYVFYNLEPHIQETNILDINHPTFRLANLSANIVTNVINIRGYDPVDHANASFSIANSAATSANTKVSKSGDTMTGSLTGVTNLGVNTITLEHSYVTTNTFTTSSTEQIDVDSFSSTTYRSAKYYVQMTSASSYHVIELSLLHDGSTVNLVQYGEIKTGSSLGTFDASITGGILSLLFTASNATTTVKLNRMVIEV